MLTPTASGSEFQVNTYTAQHQDRGNVTSLADGGYLIVWNSYRQDGDAGRDIYAQRYDSAGNVVGGEFRVNTPNAVADWQVSPEATGLADGGYIITWTSFNGQDGSSSGVYGQRFNSDGTPAGGEFQANTTLIGDQNKASVTSFANGNFVVTWASSPEVQAGIEGELMGRLYGSDGAPLGGEFQINTSVDGKQSQSSVTELADGGFVVVWGTESYFVDREGWMNFGISGQRFDATGAPVGAEFMVNSKYTWPQGNAKC